MTFRLGEEVEANEDILSHGVLKGTRGKICWIDSADKIMTYQVEFPNGKHWVRNSAITAVTGFTLPTGASNTTWEYYMPYGGSTKEKSKCECGQSATIRVNENDDPQFHQQYCIIYKEFKR